MAAEFSPWHALLLASTRTSRADARPRSTRARRDEDDAPPPKRRRHEPKTTPEHAADPAQAWPAAGHELQKLQKEIEAVKKSYGYFTKITHVKSTLEKYGFTNRGQSWKRDSLRLYPPELFPQSQVGCIRTFNGLKTYLDSALAEASPSHP